MDVNFDKAKYPGYFILYGRKAKNLTSIRRKIQNISIKEQFWVNKVYLKIGPSLIANASGMS